VKSSTRLTQNIAASALAQSAGKRMLISVGTLALLWIGIAWAVAIP
jgi:CHASE3 domain sensor protein